MAVSDISYITRTYIELIRRGFVNSPAWTGPLPEILPVSPISLEGEGLRFYLYHVIQKKEYDSFPIPTREPKARFLPMALSLYYQLTANSTNADENGPYNEQLMMSIAIKAIHDYPVIDDTTLTANNTDPVLDINIRGNNNSFHITQQPVPYTEAVHNWTAGQVPMKLSCYYEVSTVFLEPDDITSYSGRVLTYGNYVFLKGAPKITGSQNTITYQLPGETQPREIKIQPAQAPPAKDPPAVVLPESIIRFYGAGFEGGNVRLRLFHLRFIEAVVTGPDWDITVTTTNITVTVRERALLEKDNTPVDIIPGMYAAQAIVTRPMQLSDGQSKELKNTSNQAPFIISPRVDTISAWQVLFVTVTGYIFQYMDAGNDILMDAIEVYTGEIKLVKNKTALFSPGEFRIMNPSTIEINIPGPLNPGMQIPLRILIEGAESRPLWIIV